MTTKLLVLFLTAALAGCAISPAEIREHGSRTDFHLRQGPEAAAACVARNAENLGGQITGRVNATMRQGAAPGEVELVIYYKEGFLLSASFVADGPGAAASAWESPYMFKLGGRGLLAAFDGC